MPEVTIDGIRYVPAATVEHAAEPEVLEAVRELVSGIYFYGHDPYAKRGSTVLRALRALAPDIAALVESGHENDAYRAAGPDACPDDCDCCGAGTVACILCGGDGGFDDRDCPRCGGNGINDCPWCRAAPAAKGVA